MAILHVHLQEGFDNDTVVIRVNGKEVARRTGVTTKRQVGVADLLEIDVPAGPVTVETGIAARGLSNTTELPMDGSVYLGLSVEPDGLKARVSREQFGYV